MSSISPSSRSSSTSAFRLPPSAFRSGFTLIELLVVIVILGILAAVIIPRVAGRSEDARRAKAVSDIASLENALEMYRADNGRYPTSEQGLRALAVRPTSPPLPRNWAEPYLKKGVSADPWGNPYLYRCPGEHNAQSYDISSLGADGQPGGTGNDADITNWDAS